MARFRKVIAIVLAVMMMAGITAYATATDGEGMIAVSLRIEGVEEMLFYEREVFLVAGSSVEDLMVQVSETAEELGIVFDSYETGDMYISAIAGLTEMAFGGFSGWSFRVSGVSPTVGMSFVALKDMDDVVFFYGDPWGDAGMQYPFVDLSDLYTEGVLRVLSRDEVYDEDWNMTLMTNPVVGATVTLDGAAFTTDENGEIVIADTAGIAGYKRLQIERFDEESGIPTVLRMGPDSMVYVPFVDTPPNEWYEEAVMYCVYAGMFIGTDAERNLFSPMTNMTMAQLVTVLGRIAGENFSSQADPWYAEARDWAVDNAIASGQGFDADANLTREEFIYMFFLTAELVGSFDMEVRADITSAADYGDINEDYLEAVSWAVASNIIHGTSGAELTISPGFVVNRATVCQMLLNYYAS